MILRSLLGVLESNASAAFGDRGHTLGSASLEEFDNTRGRPCVMSSPATPPVWKVRMVSWVPGSPMDCAATMPTASPTSTSLPVAMDRAVAHGAGSDLSSRSVSTVRTRTWSQRHRAIDELRGEECRAASPAVPTMVPSTTTSRARTREAAVPCRGCPRGRSDSVDQFTPIADLSYPARCRSPPRGR